MDTIHQHASTVQYVGCVGYVTAGRKMLAWKWSVWIISFFSSVDSGFAVLAGGVMGIVAIPPLPFPSAAVHLPDLEPGVDAMDRMPPTGLAQQIM